MTENYLQAMMKSSHLSGGSAAYVDGLYECYLADPTSVPDEWRDYFQALPKVNGHEHESSHAEIREFFRSQAKQPHISAVISSSGSLLHDMKQAHVLQLINAYRSLGHHHAKLDPLNMAERKNISALDYKTHQLSDADLNTQFSTESALTRNGAKLSDIIARLEKTYCDTVGVEYMHITDTEQVKWLQNRLESVQSHPEFTAEKKIQILEQLTAADGLEKYLGSRYVGQKRFSLEGGDSLIPMLQEFIERAASQHVREIIIGMAHRGRLNVLVNALGKDPKQLFQEFEGVHADEKMSGDVKYHKGFSSDVKTPDGIIHLVLAFNPSHLEIIAPVVEGSVHSRQVRRGDSVEKKTVVPIIIHGDAAFAGQGVVMETFSLSQARGYSTGGTLHIVINNQIGFTTSNPLDARSTLYCTDVAKMVQAPIFHVNADDPEAVIFVTQLAFDYRMKFKRDIVIDLVCYRRHGHNEADEPSVTQPAMYHTIKNLPTPRELYATRLIEQNILKQEQAEGFFYAYRDILDKGDPVVKTVTGAYEDKYLVDWTPFFDKNWDDACDTRVAMKKLQNLGKRLEAIPDNFTLHPVITRLMADRANMTKGEMPINWGYAETLAYATLVDEGYPVRLSGQDCGRGTFAHRHAVLHDFNNDEWYVPLQHVSRDQQQFTVIDSVLSEEAVLGFEYGFAAAEPNALVIWEAQFGDFANGAQVVIDQFISSGEQKWGRLSGLVMLLPHGYEGQGPEHSSARLERYLQLCAQHNMQVCVPSTPAQVYHMLRRQLIRPYRKPLIVMTPKSLLRHKLAVSTLEDLADGEFKVVIGEIDDIKATDVRKIVLCSGKVYYDLLQQRRDNNQKDVAIIRIEQLYPFPQKALKAELAKYKNAKQIIWCQEEPKNQGAWYSSQHHMWNCLSDAQTLDYAGRDYFAAPAVGHLALHVKQQKELVEKALK